MSIKYPDDVIVDHSISTLYHDILTAHIEWTSHGIPAINNTTHTNHTIGKRSIPHSNLTRGSGNISNVHHDVSDGASNYHGSHGHSLEEDLAHSFHYASIAILAVLTVEVIFFNCWSIVDSTQYMRYLDF